jgi:hypothetical protein
MNESESIKKSMKDYNDSYNQMVENIRKSMESVSKNYAECLRKVQMPMNIQLPNFNNVFVNLEEIKRISEIAESAIPKVPLDVMIPRVSLESLLPSKEMLESFQKMAKDFEKIQSVGAISLENIRIPSIIIENATASWRAMEESVVYPDKTINFPINKISSQEEDKLNTLLSRLDPYYIKMRKNAWEKLNSDNTEDLRSSLASMRELFFSHILTSDLAPDNLFTLKNGEKITWRMRIKHIVPSDSDADLIDNAIKFSESLYSCLSKLHAKIHKIENFKESVKLYIQMSDSLMLFILTRAKI